MSSPTTQSKAGQGGGTLPADSIGLFDTTSSTLANVAPALSVFLTIPFIVGAMGSMAPWAFVLAAIAILATGNSLIEYTRRMPSAGGFISYLTRSARGSRPTTFLGSMTFYLLLFIYPVSISSVVVFTGSWAFRATPARPAAGSMAPTARSSGLDGANGTLAGAARSAPPRCTGMAGPARSASTAPPAAPPWMARRSPRRPPTASRSPGCTSSYLKS